MKNLKFLIFSLFSITVLAQKPELVVPTGHNTTISKMAISGDGKYFATTSLDKTTKVYSYPSFNELYTFPAGWEPREVGLSYDGKYAASSDIFSLRIASLASGKIVKEIENRTSDGFVFHPSEPYLYYGVFDKVSSSLAIKKLNLTNFSTTNFVTVPAKGGQAVFNILSNGSKMYLPGKNLLIDLKTAGYVTVEGNYLLPDGTVMKMSNSDKNLILSVGNSQNNKIWEKPFPDIKEYSIYTRNAFAAYGDMFYFSISGAKKIIFGNYKTGRVQVANFPKEITSSSPIFCTPNGIVYMAEKGVIYALNPQNLQVTDTYAFSSPYPAKVIAGSANANKIAIGNSLGNKEKIKVLSLGKQGISVVNGKDPFEVEMLSFNDNGTIVAMGAGNYAGIYDANDFTIINSINNPLGRSNTIGFAENDNSYFIQAPDGYSYYKEGSKTAVKTVMKPYNYSHRFNNIADITKNGQKITTFTIEKESNTSPSIERLKSYNASTGQLLWEKPGEYITVRYSNDDKRLTTVSRNPLNILELDADTGNQISSKVISGTSNERIAISKDGQFVAIYTGSNLVVYNVKTKQLTTHQNKGMFQDAMAYFGNDFLIAIEGDGRMRLYDGKNAKFIANILVYNNDDWAIITDEGYFDGSQGAIKSMYYRIGDKTASLEQFYEGFYTPGLLAQILDRSFKPSSPIIIDNIKTPPTVTIQYQQGTRNLTVEDDETFEVIKISNNSAKIIVKGTAPNDKVAELRLFHNGKLITNKSRNLTVEDDVTDADSEKLYEITLVPGQNTFKAVALNTQRTESAPAYLNILLEIEKTKSLTVASGIQLHLMVVGINEYKNPKYNLNYAVADATSFKEAIQSGMGDITSKINVHFISNSQADRGKIYTEIQTIANIANPQDIFIFYYAGHGMMSEEIKPDFYLVPYDVTQIYGDDGGIKKKGISATELKQIASTIKAQKQLYVLDACQSAGALSAVANRGAAEEKAIAQLARSTGTHWLTASGSQQFATEFDQLGHGIFTYVFLDALKGKADSGDGKITVNEIKAYLESEVPELSKKYNGSPQYPSSFGFGQDFPVSVKK